MEHRAGEADDGSLRVECDRRLKLEFHGACIASDAGLLAYRELGEALGRPIWQVRPDVGPDGVTDTQTGGPSWVTGN